MKNKVIGISISESPDMRQLGMGEMHLQDALVESARQMLRNGYSLAYGGDLGYDSGFNFTNLLFQLAMTYDTSREKKVFNYSAFPMNAMITEETEANIKSVGEIIQVIPPRLKKAWSKVRYEDATAQQRQDLDKIMRENTDTSNAIWAESLTFMRTQMAQKIDARLVMGGKLKGFKGSYPGIVEETVLCIQHKKSVVIDGRFGGAARELLRIINGKPSEVADAYPEIMRTLRSARHEFLTKEIAIIYGKVGIEHLKAITSAF